MDNVFRSIPQGGAKATELSLYVFYNTFSILRNLDRVLPSETQTDGIEGKIEELETKAGELVASVKEVCRRIGPVHTSLLGQGHWTCPPSVRYPPNPTLTG